MTTIVMCDIDGVIADNRHRLHYLEAKDYDSFYSYKEVLGDSELSLGTNLLCVLTEDDETELYFVTGRSDVCEPATALWLRMVVGYTVADEQTHLEMRKQGDHRPSPEVKVEIVEHIVSSTVDFESPNYIFIDDDPENVRAVTEKFPFVCGLVFGTDRL